MLSMIWLPPFGRRQSERTVWPAITPWRLARNAGSRVLAGLMEGGAGGHREDLKPATGVAAKFSRRLERLSWSRSEMRLRNRSQSPVFQAATAAVREIGGLAERVRLPGREPITTDDAGLVELADDQAEDCVAQDRQPGVGADQFRYGVTLAAEEFGLLFLPRQNEGRRWPCSRLSA